MLLRKEFKHFKADFPLLANRDADQPLIFLDSAASAQKPDCVLKAMDAFYREDYANIHRGIYHLSATATKLFEAVRIQTQQFINAKSNQEIIFTAGTTASMNLIVQTYARQNLCRGDEVILSEAEHHANIVPWYLLAKEIGIQLKIIPVLNDGQLDLSQYEKLFSARTKIVSISHVSNVMGIINPIEKIIATAHAHGAIAIIDGAQATPHLPVDVQALDCDFYVFSAHKMYGPTGVGILYGKQDLLAQMPPYQGGGSMIETVAFDHIQFAAGAQKFEAGTPNIAGVIGFGAALDYMQAIGMSYLFEHDQRLLNYAEAALATIKSVKIIGTAKPKIGVISFVMDKVHPHDIGTILDHAGIAIRAGHHCAMPLMTRFNVPATARISFGIYNDERDIDALIIALQDAERIFN